MVFTKEHERALSSSTVSVFPRPVPVLLLFTQKLRLLVWGSNISFGAATERYRGTAKFSKFRADSSTSLQRFSSLIHRRVATTQRLAQREEPRVPMHR